MREKIKKVIKKLAGESNKIKGSSSYRLSIPLKIYPYAILYRGKILTKEELLISKQKLDYLIKENYFKVISSIKQTTDNIECLRCENNYKEYFAMIDCKRCSKTHLYCRACLQMNRVLSCEPLYYWHDKTIMFEEKEHVNQWQGKLTSAQQYGADKAVSAFKRQTDKLIWAVTGSGKTEIVFPVIAHALEQGKRVCVASPRTDVVKEFRLRVTSAFKNVSIAALYAGSEEQGLNAQLIISTNHQLLRFKRTFDLLIIDEVDAYPYSSDQRLKKITQRSRKKQGTTIYLTATPSRALKKLPTVFISSRFHQHPLIIPQLKYSTQLNKSLKEKRLPQVFIQILNTRKKPQRQLLIFVPTVKLSTDLIEEITRLLKSQNLIKYKTEVKSVHASDEKRGEKVNKFREQKIYCLITTTILERGVTFPSVDVIVIQADNQVFNSAGLVQISGRAGRSSTDPKGHVYFIINNNTEAIKKSIFDLKYMNNLKVR